MAAPSHLYPLLRAFLATNGFTSTVAAFDKELGNNKVASQQVEGDLFEICKPFLEQLAAKQKQEQVSNKRKAEDDASEVKKTKKAKKDESSDDESSDSDADSSEEESSDESSESSDSSSESSDEEESGSDASSESSDSDESDSDSDSDSDASSSSEDDESSSDSSSDASDSSEDEKEKKKKKEKKDKKGKKEEKEDKKEKKENGKVETPTTNGFHTPSIPDVPKKNTPYKRVTEDDAALLQTRFADNTFESKRGDEFGRKAHEVLSQVRGKGFTKEKNKKKKGTYRGGTIDLGVNSVKFVYDE